VRVRVLILGGTGMLGHKLFQQARDRFRDTWCTIRGSLDVAGLAQIGLGEPADRVLEHIDVMDWPSIAKVVDELRPDVLVNCVGVIKQRREAGMPLRAITLNSLLPHRLADMLTRLHGRLVHISTDCVFSGNRGHYREDDTPDPQDLYGRSKLLGEVTYGNAITLRTSMIGRELRAHRSLLEWVLQQNNRTIRGYRRALFSGLTTNELSRVICNIIADFPTLNGLFHVASERVTKYDLVRLIVASYGLNTRVEPDDAFFCDRSLVGDRFAEATGYRCPSWPELVDELRADRTPYSDWLRRL